MPCSCRKLSCSALQKKRNESCQKLSKTRGRGNSCHEDLPRTKKTTKTIIPGALSSPPLASEPALVVGKTTDSRSSRVGRSDWGGGAFNDQRSTSRCRAAFHASHRRKAPSRTSKAPSGNTQTGNQEGRTRTTSSHPRGTHRYDASIRQRGWLSFRDGRVEMR